ncbi:hypothetical protein RB195_020530 [Necator americanus]|uniref:Reverse transcriptase domain-containing protein n=1 Tax=Necator americanus TaxID=51031 RepID=A0ABR1CJB4_NECAM
MWISSRPRTGIRVDGQPIELVGEFCYLGCMLKNNGSYERDVQQRCAKATSAFNSLTKCLWSTPITNEVKLRIYLSVIRPIMMYGSETWAAPSTVMERLDCTERKLLRRLLGRPADRLVQRILKSSSGSSWKKPPGRKRKFWTEAVKEDLRTLGVDRQFRRDKIEKVGQSCVQGRHTSAKMRVIASGDDISPPIKTLEAFWINAKSAKMSRREKCIAVTEELALYPRHLRVLIYGFMYGSDESDNAETLAVIKFVNNPGSCFNSTISQVAISLTRFKESRTFALLENMPTKR